MATNSAASRGQEKKMQYKQVDFDVNEIAPDAPAGEWQVSIPRGQCKVQPTKEEGFPMIVVPIRLDSTEEDGHDFQKALGTSLTVWLVFGGKNPRGERMSKLRIRQLCEAADVDLDIIPKKLDDPENQLQPLIKALEGKKFTAWTRLQTRRDTGETNTEIVFQDPNALRAAPGGDDDDDDDNEDERPAKKSAASGKGGRARR